MPEIWLRYGHSDVVLDVKYENLQNHFSSSDPAFWTNPYLVESDISGILNNISKNSYRFIFIFSGSIIILKLVSRLIQIYKDKNLDIKLLTTSKLFHIVKKNLSSLNIDIEIISIDKNYFEKINPNDVLFVSKISYNPFFGFSCNFTNILKYFFPDKMTDVFFLMNEKIPQPGIITNNLEFAVDEISKFNLHLLDVVTNNYEISTINYSLTNSNIPKILKIFNLNSNVHTSNISSLITSAGNDLDNHATLSDSLNSLWNTLFSIMIRGTHILLSECKNGIGDGALLKFLEGKISFTDLSSIKYYIDGLEHLFYFNEFKDKYDLGLLSTLPHYYSNKKLGFQTFVNMSEIIQTVITKYGKNHKINVLSDPDLLLLSRN